MQSALDDLVELFQSIPPQPAKPKGNVPDPKGQLEGAKANGQKTAQSGGKSNQIRVNPTNSNLKNNPAPLAPKPMVIEADSRNPLIVRGEIREAAEAIGITPPAIYSCVRYGFTANPISISRSLEGDQSPGDRAPDRFGPRVSVEWSTILLDSEEL